MKNRIRGSVGVTLADDLGAYISTLEISEGGRAGSAFEILPWQKQFLDGAFGDESQISALSCGRGQGKSAFCAAIAAAAVDPDGPLSRPRGMTIIASSSLSQSRILFGHVVHFLRSRHGALTRPNGWRSVDSPNLVLVEHLPTNCVLRAIASDPARSHGLSPSLLILDEPAQVARAFRDRLWSSLSTALGKQENSRMLVVGTRPVSGSDHFFETLLGGSADFVQCHAAPADADPGDPGVWRMANPSIDYFPELERTIAREAGRAVKHPELMPAFRALRLNSGVPDSPGNEILSAAAFARCVGEAAQDAPRSWGIDLSGGAALACVSSYSLATGALDVLGCFPGIPDLAARGRRDGCGDSYEKMAQRGELVVHDGHVVQVDLLLQEAMRRWGPPAFIGADYFQRAALLQALNDAGVPKCKVEFRRNGFSDGAEDLARFRRAALDRSIIATPSLLLTSALAEARSVASTGGLEKLGKSTQGGRRHLARDDALAAAIAGVAVGERNRPKVEEPELQWAVAR